MGRGGGEGWPAVVQSHPLAEQIISNFSPKPEFTPLLLGQKWDFLKIRTPVEMSAHGPVRVGED